MLGFLHGNAADILVCGIIILVCILIVINEIKTGKRIKAAGGCCGNCGYCSAGCSGCGAHKTHKKDRSAAANNRVS